MLKKIFFLMMTFGLMFMEINAKTITIGDKVWLDSNRNGVQDEGESGFSGIEVELLKDGTHVDYATSTSIGWYNLTSNLGVGKYSIKVNKTKLDSMGLMLVPSLMGDSSKDSNINPATFESTAMSVTCSSGKCVDDWDVGLYYKPSSIRGHVWIDTDKNGVDDKGEIGAKGITVNLYKNTEPSKIFMTKLTDANGNYSFCNLDAGEYFVEFKDVPTGNKITQKDQGGSDWSDSDANPSNGKTDVIALKAGEINDYMDMGFYDDGSTPSNKANLGDFVWLDLDEDGVQDKGESGVEGIKVTLYDATDKVVETKTTDKNGQYMFENLTPADYYVIFTVSSEYKVSPKNSGGDDKIDSDADDSGKSDMVKLIAGATTSTVDIGLYKNGATIGDKVWFDANDNGVIDSDESGVQDITVTLYNADTNQQVGVATKTNATGDYHFTGVVAGKYYVIFSGLSDKQMFSGKNGVDANGKTQIFTLSNGQNIDTVDAPIKEAGVLSAKDDTAKGETGKSVKVDVLANDTKGKYNIVPSSVKIVSLPSGATLSADGKKLTVPNQGVWSVDNTTGAITFTPNNGFNANPTPIEYSVEDEQKNIVSAKVTVVYPPVAVDDVKNAREGNATIIYVLENDKISSSPFDKSTLKIIDPQNKNEVNSLTVAEGVWSVEQIENQAVIKFTPASGSSVAPQPIEYVVADKNGDKTNLAKVTINYYNVADDVFEVRKGGKAPYTIDVLKNDKNVGKDVKIGQTCDKATSKELTVKGEGTWKVNADGTVTFTPEAGFDKNPTDIKYNVDLADGTRSNCGNIDIRHIPLANDDSAVMVNGGVTIVDILANDIGDFNASSVKLIKGANSTLSADGKTLTVNGEGEWKVDENGILTFTPKNGFTALPTPIKYIFTDKDGTLSNEGSVTLTKGSSTQGIHAENDVANANGSKPIVIEILKNDTGDINKSSVGFIYNNTTTPVKEVDIKDEGKWSVDNNGIVTFTPASGFEGTPKVISYVVFDNAGNRSNIATITIKGSCSCEDYTSSVGVFDNNMWFVLMTLTTLLFAFFATRREENN